VSLFTTPTHNLPTLTFVFFARQFGPLISASFKGSKFFLVQALRLSLLRSFPPPFRSNHYLPPVRQLSGGLLKINDASGVRRSDFCSIGFFFLFFMASRPPFFLSLSLSVGRSRLPPWNSTWFSIQGFPLVMVSFFNVEGSLYGREV